MNFYNKDIEIIQLYECNFLENIYFFLKFSIFLFLLSIIYINIENEIIVNIDNNIDEKLYESNLNFSKYSTQIKVIALYYPNYQNIDINISFNEWTIINHSRPLLSNHHQPRKPGDINNYLEYYDSGNPQTILKQIDLAKSHGIYGFGIYYYWFSGKKLFEKTIELFLENKNINFPFFLIWKNEDYKRNIYEYNKTIFIKQNYKKGDFNKFIKDISKYLISQKYININRKPLLGINDIRKIPNFKENLLTLRKTAKTLGIGEIFILSAFNNINDKILQILDAAYELPPTLYYRHQESKKYIYYYYYSTLFYELKKNNINNNKILFKSNIVEWDNTPENRTFIIYNEYSPLKFYNSNKILLDWTNKYLNSTNKFFFINSWNNWLEGSYLEPDENYGYASINALSKALFKLAYKEQQYNFLELTQVSKILVLLHLSHLDKFNDTINKINNIPVKFDLIISTFYTKKMLKELIVKHSKAHIYEIISLKGKEKNKLSLLIQIRKKIKKYKYFIHLYLKASKNKEEYESILMKYLYQNLLGSNEIVSQILNDFENTEHLGFIFPEILYFNKTLPILLSKNIRTSINSIISKISPGYVVGKIFKYPLGNMFWARIDAVYQIFEPKFIKIFSKEKEKLNNEMVKLSEIIWLYLVKINGYFYKTIFNSF